MFLYEVIRFLLGMEVSAKCRSIFNEMGGEGGIKREGGGYNLGKRRVAHQRGGRGKINIQLN